MDYIDRIYGKIEISEPVILDLIKSLTLQRLKNIDQIGYSEPYFPGASHSRFEHSLGVFILLKRFGAPLEEQIAGLIHDVSHSAFSHCVDYVLGDSDSEKNHGYQDDIFETFIINSEIPKIFNKYKINTEYILEDLNFPLKERDLPDLCADRIDYSLRTALIFREANKSEIDYFLDNLMIDNNYWVFKNFENAKKYADLFLTLNSKYYAGIKSAVMFLTVGDCLKYALNNGYITKEDLYTTDKEIIEKISNHLNKDQKLNFLFERMNNKFEYEENLNNFDAKLFCKSRVVDPLFKDEGRIKKISDIDLAWKTILKKELKPKEYFIKFKK